MPGPSSRAVVWAAAGAAGFAWVNQRRHAAAVLRTTDGGTTWERLTVPGAESDSLKFRDVHAVDAEMAYVLAAGPGNRSRIYKTTDAGRTWQTQFVNSDSSAFYDCFAFCDAAHGVASATRWRGGSCAPHR